MLPVDEERHRAAALSQPTAVVGELQVHLVLARTDRALAVDLEALQAEEVVAVGKSPVTRVEREAAERAPPCDRMTPLPPPSGTTISAVIACDLFFRERIELSDRRPIRRNSSWEVPRTSCGRPARSGLNCSKRRSSSGSTLYFLASSRKRRWSSASLSGSWWARSCACVQSSGA